MENEKHIAKMRNLPSGRVLQSWIEGCKAERGCCAWKYGCCMRPRTRTPLEGDVYMHCLDSCPCRCIRRRGFVGPWAKGVDDFVSGAELDGEWVVGGENTPVNGGG